LCVKKLGDDLRPGAWDERHGKWCQQLFFDGSLRLIAGLP
jgi:prepilin-type processing-associated H-X9-DG protein